MIIRIGIFALAFLAAGSSPATAQQVYQEYYSPENWWGITAGGTLGEFSSKQMKRFVGRLSGHEEVYVEGRAFDVGLAWGDPCYSFWRFTFAGKSIQDSSFTRYLCPECNTEVTASAVGMSVLGVKAERVQRFGPAEWRVHPAGTVHVGVGRVLGRAIKEMRSISGSATAREQANARILFGNDFFPIAGAGVGVVGDVGGRLTLGVTIIGFEYPGIYYGGVQLTVWP